jgi:hypothetical protein
MQHVFGAEIAADKSIRNHRFLEEALELVQANGCSQSEAHQLVEYVFGRPIGDPDQEMGGVMVTLAALANASGLLMWHAGVRELQRVWQPEIVNKIRHKSANKPKFSPLPGPGPDDKDVRLNSSGSVAVDHNYFFERIDENTPQGVKLQLLGQGGVAIYGTYRKGDDFWTHWAPLPKVRP